jgi:hypothetical protein
MKVKTSRKITAAVYNTAFYGTVIFIVGSYLAAKMNKE